MVGGGGGGTRHSDEGGTKKDILSPGGKLFEHIYNKWGI